MTQNGEHKPTCNGVIKGRPGKGKVLSLGQRRRCYANHAMTPDNTFKYTPKPTESNRKPLEREWCKRCRTDSRKRSRIKRLKDALMLAKANRAKLAAAMPKASGNGKVKALANVARKGRNASAADLDAVLGKATATSRPKAQSKEQRNAKKRAQRAARKAA